MAENGSPFIDVAGTFYKAVDVQYAHAVLDGSHAAGRYSSPDEPTLYLSASIEGVETAMIKHAARAPKQSALLTFTVEAQRIVDLRDASAMARLGVDPQEAFGDWQAAVASGQIPTSWRVRRRLEARGAQGLIDPSRRRPGLWHLTLFAWNRKGAPSVKVHPGEKSAGEELSH
ncbi:RES family NAD+ phosphorylase [Citricoccus muralis]|uniref:RES domain-containing protein n=1 Tax=Citricoccus muralis TaxID=169134 RepID=A0ABY8H3N5_9MICC|nr:RES domain-containing protein [Citricoccus muralis]WFP15740.1 RES domain-containing protein [Citricoccus muralis]